MCHLAPWNCACQGGFANHSTSLPASPTLLLMTWVHSMHYNSNFVRIHSLWGHLFGDMDMIYNAGVISQISS